MENLSHLAQIDRDTITALIDDALAANLVVTVHDGEAFALKRSTDRAAILAALASTDEDRVIFADPRDPVMAVGHVVLIYGNEPGVVIANTSEGERMQNLLTRAEAMADAYLEAV